MSDGKMLDFNKLAGNAISANNILNLGGYSKRILYPSSSEGYEPNTYVPAEANGVYDMGDQDPYGRKGYQSMNTQYEDLNARANLNSDMQGGLGGDKRAPRKLDMTPGEWQLEGSEYKPDQAPVQQPPADDAEKKAVEDAAAAAGSIEELLAVLRKLASMEPGEGNPVFQLDSMYKGSDAYTGIPDTQAQTPVADGRALTTFNLGTR